MSKSTVKANAGICGFISEITAVSQDGQNVQVTLKTDCSSLAPMAKELSEINAFSACFGKPCDSTVYTVANKYCAHAACPVPGAIIKAIEVACGFALPKDVHIVISKDE